MAIEQLTDGEHAELGAANSRYDVGCKALRIIDAHAADRAALVAQLEAAKAETEQVAVRYREERDAHDRLLEEAEDYSGKCEALRAQVAELTLERDEARTRVKFLESADLGNFIRIAEHQAAEITRLNGVLVEAEHILQIHTKLANDNATHAEAAESDVTRLTEALALMRDCSESAEARVGELEERVARASASAIVADTQLAAANALLERWIAPKFIAGMHYDLVRETEAHLSTQPATAPALENIRGS